MSGLVEVNGTSFRLNGKSFFCSGVNCYFLGFCAEEIQREIISTAKSMGANTIRAWAFLELLNREPGLPAFQYVSEGKLVFDDGADGLERLDSLIALAEYADLRLLLPLANYWRDFGGVPFYLERAGLSGGSCDFFRSPRARFLYQRWVEHLLLRRNTRTGRLYSEEPAIFGWELMNEPRCAKRADKPVLLEWVEEMSQFVKERDSNHLLAVGDEGFFYRRTRSHLYDGCYGVDTLAFLELRAIDFGTYHLYPDSWGLNGKPHQVDSWIGDHLVAAQRANKPMLLEEFAIRENQRTCYAKWISKIRREGGAGALVWMLGSQHASMSGYRDVYTIEDVSGFASLFE